MIIISKYLIPKGYIGLTLWPFIILKCNDLKWNKRLVNHEKIHIRQQLELFILPFYLIYGVEFLIRFALLQQWSKAYKSISFEREAYANEDNLMFLKKRPFWNFIHYF